MSQESNNSTLKFHFFIKVGYFLTQALQHGKQGSQSKLKLKVKGLKLNYSLFWPCTEKCCPFLLQGNCCASLKWSSEGRMCSKHLKVCLHRIVHTPCEKRDIKRVTGHFCTYFQSDFTLSCTWNVGLKRDLQVCLHSTRTKRQNIPKFVEEPIL